MKRWLKNRRTALDTPTSVRTLALFRISFCAILLLVIGHVNDYRPIFFDAIPGIARNPFPAKLFIGIWTLSVVMVMAGLATRWFAIVNYCMVVIATFFFTNAGAGSFNDDLLRIGSFLMIIMPVHRTFSLDNLLQRVQTGSPFRTTTSYLHILAMLFVSLGLMYWASGLTKSYSPMWSRGLGLWIPASMPYNRWNDLSFFLDIPWLMIALNYAVIVWEIVFIVCLFFPRTHTFIAISGVLLHAGIAAIFPFPLMCAGPLPFYLLFIKDSFWQKICKPSGDPKLLTLNANDRKQLVFGRFIKAFDLRNTINIIWSEQPTMFGWKDTISILNRFLVLKPLAWLCHIELVRLFIDLVVTEWLTIPVAATEERIGYSLKRLSLLIFCIAMFSVQLFSVCYHANTRLRGAISEEKLRKYYYIRKDVHDLSMKPSNLFRTLFGINARGVFLDHSNMGVKYIYGLTFTDKDGSEKWLPFFDEHGHALGMNKNMHWSKYTFNSVCNGPEPNISELKKVTWFWAWKTGTELNHLRINVYRKDLKFPVVFEKGYHRKLDEQSWTPFGTIDWKDGTFNYTGLQKDSL